MKLLIICQHFYPEQFKISDISFKLAEQGHDVTVLTGLPNYPSGIIDKEYRMFKRRKEIINGVKIYRSWLIPRRKNVINLSLNYLSFAFSSTIKSLFIKEKFDHILVYQTSPITMALAGVFLTKLTKKPLIIYCLDLWPESVTTIGIKKGSFIYKMLFHLSKWIYKQADEIFTSSRMFEDYFKNVLLIDKKTTYLPGYAEDVFEQLPPKEHKENINLVFAGNIGKMQSVETIVLAANELKKNKEIVFHIVGDGSAKKECEELASKLALENVVFHGQHPLSEMPKFYKMADAFLITMKDNNIISYTLPNKVQSYLASAKPILGAINGETNLVIKDANCGFCGPAEDYRRLAENIILFAGNIAMHSTYGENARKYYESNYSKDIYFNKLGRLLNREDVSKSS